MVERTNKMDRAVCDSQPLIIKDDQELYLTNFGLVFSFLAVGKVFLGWVVTNCLLFEAGMHLINNIP